MHIGLILRGTQQKPRWAIRVCVYAYTHLSFSQYLSIYIFLHLCVYLSYPERNAAGPVLGDRCMCVCMHTHTHISLSLSLSLSLSISKYLYLSIYLYVHISIYIYIYIYIYLSTYLYLSIYIYIYIL